MESTTVQHFSATGRRSLDKSKSAGSVLEGLAKRIEYIQKEEIANDITSQRPRPPLTRIVPSVLQSNSKTDHKQMSSVDGWKQDSVQLGSPASAASPFTPFYKSKSNDFTTSTLPTSDGTVSSWSLEIFKVREEISNSLCKSEAHTTPERLVMATPSRQNLLPESTTLNTKEPTRRKNKAKLLPDEGFSDILSGWKLWNTHNKEAGKRKDGVDYRFRPIREQSNNLAKVLNTHFPKNEDRSRFPILELICNDDSSISSVSAISYIEEFSSQQSSFWDLTPQQTTNKSTYIVGRQGESTPVFKNTQNLTKKATNKHENGLTFVEELKAKAKEKAAAQDAEVTITAYGKCVNLDSHHNTPHESTIKNNILFPTGKDTAETDPLHDLGCTGIHENVGVGSIDDEDNSTYSMLDDMISSKESGDANLTLLAQGMELFSESNSSSEEDGSSKSDFTISNVAVNDFYDGSISIDKNSHSPVNEEAVDTYRTPSDTIESNNSKDIDISIRYEIELIRSENSVVNEASFDSKCGKALTGSSLYEIRPNESKDSELLSLHPERELIISKLGKIAKNETSLDNKSSKILPPILEIDVPINHAVGYGWYVKPMWQYSSQMTAIQSERVRQLRKQIRKLKDKLEI